MTDAPPVEAIDCDHVRFQLPDLDAQARFLKDFGFEVDRREDALRALARDGTAPYRAKPGEARFLGFGLRVESEADIHTLVSQGARLDLDDGQNCAALVDPDGWEVRAIARSGIPSDTATLRNEAGRHERGIGRYAIAGGPSHVLRLGHIVLQARDFAASFSFYTETFGMLASDEIEGFDGSGTIGAFLRCDRGERPADHHTLFLMQSPDGTARFEHAAFEVRDIDDLMVGHDHLAQAGHKHSWGVGRHILGAHVFDYWRDPAGFELEHWTDGDLLDASEKPGRHPLATLMGAQWGPPHPMIRSQ